ncbi:MAG: PAS domain S-box protein [Thermodesulfobacteriota bacterium]
MANFWVPNHEKDHFEFEVYKKEFFIKILLFFGLPTVSYFTIQDSLQGRPFVSFFRLLMFGTLIALLIGLWYPAEKRKKYIFYRALLSLFLFLFGTYLIYTIGVEQTSYRLYWSYLFPILVFYALGIKEALLWNLLFCAGITLSVSFTDFQSIPIESSKTTFFISFFLVSIMSFVLAYQMRRDQSALLAHQRTLKNEIEERKRAEDALRESEERYRTILENIEDGYYEVDLPGRLTFFNDSLCKILGYAKDEMMGMPNKQYTDEENRKKLYQAFNDVYRTGKPMKGFDWQVFTKDGRKIFGEVSVSLIRDSKGEPIGFRGIARDITLRKQAEEALRTEKQRFERLLENAPFGLILIDQKGDFKYVNAKFVELFGYGLNEIPNGREWFRKAYPAPDYRHHVIETWIQDTNVTGPGENVPRIFTATCKDGTRKIVRFITVQLGTGEYLMSCEDITHIQRAEEEKAILAEQLRQSQKMEAIGRLAGGIAHDFNNLLTVIRGYTQLSLLELDENDKLRGNLEEIQKATQRASDLTHHLLAFSRRQIMEMKIVDLNVLLKDLDKMLHRVIGEDIQLTYHLSDALGKIRVDPAQMQQVILNLAVNARDAMPCGGKLTIETANAKLDEAYAHTHIGAKPGRYVMMSVSDTGLGMSAEVKERAFEPFFTTKEKGKGTGLGLSTCYGIVKQSGGNIWAYSEAGKGTTFKIYLPRTDDSLEDANAEEDRRAEMHRGFETILEVEDEIEVRKLVAQVLTNQGYTVLEASDGKEALKVVRENAGKKIDLLLTDVVMPGMSGRELAEALGLRHPKMKVLYMSGYTDDAIVHHGVLEEGINYIQKPFTLDALARKVREVLDRKG